MTTPPTRARIREAALHPVTALALALAIAPLPGCALFCPRQPVPLLHEFSLVTPEAAFHSFRMALEVGSPDYEFRCLSDRLRRENEISFDKYVLGRPYVLRKYRKEIRRFERSEIVDVEYGVSDEGEELAIVRLSDGEVEGTFLLVNEPYWEMHVRGETGERPPPPLYDFPWRLEELLESDGSELRARIPLPRRPRIDPDDIVGLELKDEWGVLDFYGLNEISSVDAPASADDGRATPEP